ncbi:MAG: hypothetical protein JWP89_5976 [Schlesneria sp.]|nr:hypothetical protein [Schlesneria sp.]
MWAIFHGWRRKAGVATLVMACALSSLWVRSLAMPVETGYEFRTELRTSYIQIQLECAEHHDEESNEPYTVFENIFRFAVPYSAMTIPLMLLSAYLIIWKPRKQKTSAPPANSNLNSN